MGTPLRALIVEDSEDDAALLVRELERGGYRVSFERVDTPEALTDALERGGWDILFADYTMPRFRGTVALEMVRSGGHDLPFIFVSGTIGEDVAVAAMKAGAHDYVIKGHLKRLVPAVARELRDAAVRRERRRVEAERRAAEEALRASQERHRLLFQHIADVILVLDRNGMMRFASASVREVLGYEPEALSGRPSLELVHPDDEGRARESFARVTGRPDALETVDVRIRHGDGSWRSMDCVLRNLLHHPDIQGLVVTCRDITERKRLEAEFLQAQKLESVGRLAGAIAHDFNNVLTSILGNAALLAETFDPTDDRRADLEEIRQAAERAAALTHQLLAFSRKQVLQPRVVSLNTIVAGMENMLRRLIGEDVVLRAVLADDLEPVRADPGQLEQVLMNLAVNARDAMPDGGQLTIETANVELDDTYAARHIPVTPGRYVMLAVSDTGRGMDKATQARLFEPFFTTKAAGKGTGLGLATVYGIVTQSGGYIWVYSEPGNGATFKVYLPRVTEAETVEEPAVAPAVLGGSETLLLVEDEPGVRHLARRVLERYGYQVHEAAAGNEAVRLAAARAVPFDLLVTDVVLPEYSGRELAERLGGQARRVLYMSGYTDNAIVHHGVLDPGVAFVQKPFTPEALARKVREVLDAPLPEAS